MNSSSKTEIVTQLLTFANHQSSLLVVALQFTHYPSIALILPVSLARFAAKQLWSARCLCLELELELDHCIGCPLAAQAHYLCEDVNPFGSNFISSVFSVHTVAQLSES